MTSKLQIVVADRGWVYIGQVEKTDDGVTITGAHNVRRWGTIGGLGELATKGPTESTKLDPYGTVHVPTHAVVCLIDVPTASPWTHALSLLAAA